ncbi:hypothetical protein M885DRAFT_574276 [Pelagophyceae sp. CCMP2097]|nr:hypothetical protein M885DRAFT_574276 [Pelagophyceae sp. CCMP2097]
MLRVFACLYLDGYAGAWLQAVERFLLVDLKKVGSLEGSNAATKTSVQLHGGGDVLQSHDFLDFAVEHLSWKMAGPSQYDRNTKALERFSARMRRDGAPARRRRGADALRADTVCVMPLYADRNGDELARAALATTIASINNVFGWIVVTVSTPFDGALALDVRRVPGSAAFQIVKLVAKSAELPRATLAGLQRALRLRGQGGADVWLGNQRPRAVRDALDAGRMHTIVILHRLQGLPEPHDVSVSVTWVDAGASCLDTASYLAFAPDYPRCDDFWYRCGGPGARIAAYGLLRLRAGTGLTARD